MIKFVYQSTLKDLARPQRTVAWVVVIVMVFIIAKVWAILAADLSSSDSFARVHQAVVLRVLALVSAIFGTMVLSHEVEQKTLVYLITRPIKRSTLLAGRMLAAATICFGVAVLSYIAAGLAVLGPSIFLSTSLLQDILVMAIGILSYVGLFVFLSLILAKSLVISLLFAFGWETFVPNMPGDMYYLSVLTYLRSAAPHAVVAGGPSLGDVITGALSPKSVATQTAWIILLAMCAFFWLISLWWFSRFEYSPREDSD